MTELKVDYQLLDSIERDLSFLVSEFQHIQARTGECDGAMGSGDIAGAMGGFSGNWDYHRKRLIGSMQSLGQMVSQTRKSFQDADNRLKASQTKK